MVEHAEQTPRPDIDWESFYANYRKPGYVAGYEIVNKLGGGVFGLVFKARKESIGKHYAIKFLKVDDKAVRDAVSKELEAVHYFAQIDHPNLVSIEDKGEVDGIPYIIMNYAGEGTLQKRLEAGAMSRDDALRVFIQAARGIQALHEHSLVHFDLKPANIFLRGDIARVGDYGLSKLVTESNHSLSFGRGTPYYMAPEMLQRRGDVRSDVYSLGVILYECLLGKVPFKGDTEWQVLRKHETEDPELPATVVAPERQVLLRCMAKKPADRYQAVADLLHDLQAPASLGESMVLPPAGAPDSQSVYEDRYVAGEAVAGEAVAASSQQPPLSAHGFFGRPVHLLFRAFEMLLAVILPPIKVVSLALAEGLHLLVTFPVKILGVTFKIAGFLIILILVLMMAFLLLSPMVQTVG